MDGVQPPRPCGLGAERPACRPGGLEGAGRERTVGCGLRGVEVGLGDGKQNFQATQSQVDGLGELTYTVSITAQGWLKEQQVSSVSTYDATNRPGSSASGSSEHAAKQR